MALWGHRDLPRSTKELAYQRLRHWIIQGDLLPGRKISESEIASRVGVSRTPAREALAALSQEGLVDIVPQLGTFVTLISEDAIIDALFARTALECAAIRMAAERSSAADLDHLYANLAEQEIAANTENVVVFDRLDQAFHLELCDLSGHHTAWDLTDLVRGQLDRVRELGMRELQGLPQLAHAHRQIADAVATNDPDLADELLRGHLESLMSTLPALRSVHPEYFMAETSAPASLRVRVRHSY